MWLPLYLKHVLEPQDILLKKDFVVKKILQLIFSF